MNKYESPEWSAYTQSEKTEAIHSSMSELIEKVETSFEQISRDMRIMAEKIEKLENGKI